MTRLMDFGFRRLERIYEPIPGAPYAGPAFVGIRVTLDGGLILRFRRARFRRRFLDARFPVSDASGRTALR